MRNSAAYIVLAIISVFFQVMMLIGVLFYILHWKGGFVFIRSGGIMLFIVMGIFFLLAQQEKKGSAR